MSRSGYTDDLDYGVLNLYRANVSRALSGSRGQSFLRELAEAMDAMQEKILIADELVNESGDCCAIGAVCLSRGVDVSEIDYECPESVAKAMGIARCMAAEIEYMNDEWNDRRWNPRTKQWDYETPENRWKRMRKWVDDHLKPTSEEP